MEYWPPQRPKARGPFAFERGLVPFQLGGIANWHQVIEEANPPLPRCEPWLVVRERGRSVPEAGTRLRVL